MANNRLVPVEDFCTTCNVSLELVTAFRDFELVEIEIIEGKSYVSADELRNLESLVYFYDELQINLEGLDVIVHLLRQIHTLQKELASTRSRLLPDE